MTNKKVRKIYEAGLHLVPTAEEGKVSSVFEDVKASVASESEILSEEVPHLQQLAYTVRQSDGTYSRYDEAYFGSIKFRASQEGMMKIKQSMQGNENILRFIVLEAVEEDTRIGETLPGEEVEEEEVEKKEVEKKEVEEEVEEKKAGGNTEESKENSENSNKETKEKAEEGIAENSDGDKK